MLLGSKTVSPRVSLNGKGKVHKSIIKLKFPQIPSLNLSLFYLNLTPLLVDLL